MVRGQVVSKKKGGNKQLPNEVSEAIIEIGGLENLSSNIPSIKDLELQIKLHRALSDKTRLKILWAIRCCDLCPCVLKEYLKVSDSRLSYHLSYLEGAGLVISYQKKNWRIFSITDLGKDALGRGSVSKETQVDKR
ncbi:MAG: metalloregulator ArsR/SmtB family transcription factor [Euryarchaeota archaeon]|nr:metalloregulator ArsR/SmtB family transcription factor [Euryarchaeota archaeon]